MLYGKMVSWYHYFISIDIVEPFFDCEVCVMGRFVNPGNEAFRVVLNSEIYIDKTGLANSA